MTERLGAQSLAIELTSGVDFAGAFGRMPDFYRKNLLRGQRGLNPPRFEPEAIELSPYKKERCKQNAQTFLAAVSGKDISEKFGNLRRLDEEVVQSGGDLFTTVGYLVFPDKKELRQELDDGLRAAAGQALDRAELNSLSIGDGLREGNFEIQHLLEYTLAKMASKPLAEKPAEPEKPTLPDLPEW